MANDFEFPWVQMMNVKPALMEPGRLSLRHSPEAIHLNHNGDVNASALFCLGEMSGSGVLVVALGSAAKDAFVVIKKGTIEYLFAVSATIPKDAAPLEQQRLALN